MWLLNLRHRMVTGPGLAQAAQAAAVVPRQGARGRRRDGRGPTQRLISEIDLGACDRTQRTSASGRVHASDETRADRRERPGEAARFEAVSEEHGEEGFLKFGVVAGPGRVQDERRGDGS